MYELIAQAETNTLLSDLMHASSPWIQKAREFLATNAIDFGLRILAALAIFFIGRMVSGFLLSLAQNGLKRSGADAMLLTFSRNVLKALLLIIVTMASLQTLGVEMTSVTAILAAAGFAVGMALQGSLSNFAAGIMLVVVKPFRVGDFVDIAGVSGTVKEIGIFSSILQTFDGLRLTVPNGQVTANVIKNFSIEPVRMIPLVIGCSYNDDLLAVKKLLQSLLEQHENVLEEPAPLVAVDELGNSSVNFVVRPWVNSSDFGNTKRELTEQIKLAFDEKGFTFPFPSRDLYVHRDASSTSI